MRRSKNEMDLHIVWATKHREELLTPEVERAAYRCIISEAQNMKCNIRAINDMPDHVHLLMKMPLTLALSDVMKRLKGISSAMINDLPAQPRFRWQEGYAVYCVCPSHVQEAVDYIANQKQHHADGTTISEWEEADEEVEP